MKLVFSILCIYLFSNMSFAASRPATYEHYSNVTFQVKSHTVKYIDCIRNIKVWTDFTQAPACIVNFSSTTNYSSEVIVSSRVRGKNFNRLYSSFLKSRQFFSLGNFSKKCKIVIEVPSKNSEIQTSRVIFRFVKLNNRSHAGVVNCSREAFDKYADQNDEITFDLLVLTPKGS